MRVACLLLAAAFGLAAQSLKDFEKKVTEFTLPNGLHFIVVERHEAPVVSFHTYVDAGSVNDPGGRTGIAHMFEHMAFKGTEQIGTKDWAAEKKALEEVEQVYDRLEAEKRKRRKADPQRLKTLETSLKLAIERANLYADSSVFARIIEENGGVGLNASTGMDSTRYYYNFPANRIELWFLLESRRFLTPVYREFYKERDVVLEERRMRVESNPQGKLMEMLISTAFAAHPYGNMPGGWASDIVNLRVEDAAQFFRNYYQPGNLTMAVVGDVNPAEVKKLAERYFGTLPAGPLPPLLHTEEPPQEGPKRVFVESPSQPLAFVAYKRPDQYHQDDPVLDVIGGILSSGRTGVLYRELVRDRKLSLAAAASPSFPGSKFKNLFLFFLVPSAGKTVEDNLKAFDEILEDFKGRTVDNETLSRVKTKTRAAVIRQLDSNSGLAAALSSYQANYGDWRKLFTSLDEIDKVTAAEVQTAARKYFVPSARTIAQTVAPAKAAGGAR
ncbi:MAG: pitrilysin family protein [Bryobacteraceae bacterium]